MVKELNGAEGLIGEIEGVDYVVCAICGGRFKLISSGHLNKHNITMNEYKNLYPNAKIYAEETIKKHKIAVIVRSNDPEWQKNQKIAGKERSEDPEWQKSMKIAGEKLSNDPVWRENQKNGAQKRSQEPEWIINNIISNQKKPNDPEWVKNHAEGCKKRNEDPEYISLLKIGIEKRSQDPQWIANQLIGAEKRDANSDRAKKISASHQGIPYEEWAHFLYGEDDWHDWSKVIYLNERFSGCHRHHITETLVICIPAELHNHISHNLKTGRGMGEMNMLALQFMNGCYND